MNRRGASRESIAEKITVSAVQAVLTAVIATLLGLWLNHRLEAFKAELAAQAGETAERRELLREQNLRRISAYEKLRSEAMDLDKELAIWFGVRGDAFVEDVEEALVKIEMNLEYGDRSIGGSWTTDKNISDLAKTIVDTLKSMKGQYSVEVQEAALSYLRRIAGAVEEGKRAESQQVRTRRELYADCAQGYKTLNSSIDSAIGMASSPIK